MDEHFCVEGELLGLFKQRWENTDINEFDPLIIPLLRMINSNPNIATMWSCSGHIDNPKHQNTHVVMAASYYGYRILKDFYLHIDKWMKENLSITIPVADHFQHLYPRFDLTCTKLLIPFEISPPNMRYYYPAIKISWSFGTISSEYHERVIDGLHQVAHSMPEFSTLTK